MRPLVLVYRHPPVFEGNKLNIFSSLTFIDSQILSLTINILYENFCVTEILLNVK